jgi:hypothetical protein
MKIIITENQYKKINSLKRRLADIMREASLMIDNADDFYGDVDFCRYYPTLKKFLMDGLVINIIQQYEPDNYDIDDIENFINTHIGYKNFVNMIMDMYGEKIENFYNEKTQDC